MSPTAFRLVVWNCNQAFARKAEHLAAIRPDVAVVPECGMRDAEAYSSSSSRPSGRSWVGANRSKGLATFSFGAYSLRLDSSYDERVQWVAPLHVEGPVRFCLLAVWAMNHRASVFHPQPPTRRQVQQGLVVYEALSALGPVVVAGDFNAAVVWDRKRPHPENFTATAQALRERNLVSAYHAARGVPLGAEPDPTLYWRDRTAEGPRYHIDYCFVPTTWLAGLCVEVGTHADWVATGLSDHAPLVVDVSTVAPEA